MPIRHPTATHKTEDRFPLLKRESISPFPSPHLGIYTSVMTHPLPIRLPTPQINPYPPSQSPPIAPATEEGSKPNHETLLPPPPSAKRTGRGKNKRSLETDKNDPLDGGEKVKKPRKKWFVEIDKNDTLDGGEKVKKPQKKWFGEMNKNDIVDGGKKVKKPRGRKPKAVPIGLIVVETKREEGTGGSLACCVCGGEECEMKVGKREESLLEEALQDVWDKPADDFDAEKLQELLSEIAEDSSVATPKPTHPPTTTFTNIGKWPRASQPAEPPPPYPQFRNGIFDTFLASTLQSGRVESPLLDEPDTGPPPDEGDSLAEKIWGDEWVKMDIGHGSFYRRIDVAERIGRGDMMERRLM
ncbi:hypothetical protein HDV00_003928 [Rhizophlyctis rosea]|nr:hypothetical protein HDV00_003928 [Rhizophlyctis rosea]